jgi:hypothetical protein
MPDPAAMQKEAYIPLYGQLTILESGDKLTGI